MKLTKTQADLLAVLRAYRASADASEAEDNARALGGLTPGEKFERGAFSCRSQRHVSARRLDGIVVHAYNVKTVMAALAEFSFPPAVISDSAREAG